MLPLAEVVKEKSFSVLPKTHLMIKKGAKDSSESTELKVPINFYASKLLDGNDSEAKNFGYCLVIQPIVWEQQD